MPKSRSKIELFVLFSQGYESSELRAMLGPLGYRDHTIYRCRRQWEAAKKKSRELLKSAAVSAPKPAVAEILMPSPAPAA